MSILSHICADCVNLCQSVLFNDFGGRDYLSSQGFDDEDLFTMQDLLQACESNQIFFEVIAIPHLIGSAIVNKHVACLHAMYEHGWLQVLFDTRVFFLPINPNVLAFLVDREHMKPIEQSECPVHANIFTNSKTQMHHYSNWYDLLLSHFDESVFRYVMSCTHLYLGHNLVTIKPLSFLVKAINHQHIGALPVLLSMISISIEEFCHRCTSIRQDCITQQLVDFCRPYVTLDPTCTL